MANSSSILMRTSIQTMSMVVVKLEFYCGSVPLGIGTGFYERLDGRRYLVTNWHCVTGREPHNGATKSADGITPDAVIVHGHRAIVNSDGSTGFASGPPITQRVPIEHGPDSKWRMHSQGQAIDVAVAEIDYPIITDGGHMIDCCISNLSAPNAFVDAGDDLVVIGFPDGLSPTGTLPIWKSGIIATEPAFPAGGEPCFWLECATRPGMSGSPVFKRSSETTEPIRSGNLTLINGMNFSFVGIYSGRIGTKDKVEAILGKVWHPEVIYEVMRLGVPLSFCEITDAVKHAK